MKWFQHQSKAHTDAKLQKLLIKYGFEGYGLYWYCIESVCQNLEPALTFELEQDSEILAHIGRMDSRVVEEMMLYMVNVGLFTESDGVIFCHKLARYLGTSSTWNNDLKEIIKFAKAGNDIKSSQIISENLRISVPEEKRREEKRRSKTYTSSVAPSDRVPAADIVELYHKILPELPPVKKLTDTRRSYIKQRWKQGDLPSLEHWEMYFNHVRGSDFLMGKTEGRGGSKPFKASLEWLTKPANYAKVYEGNYHGV